MDRPTPTAYQPTLTWQEHALRYVAMLVVSVGTTLWMIDAGGRNSQSTAAMAMDLTLGVAGFALFAFRRRWALPVAVLLVLFGAFSAAVTGPSWVGLVTLSTRRRWLEIVPVAALFVATATYFILHQGLASAPVWVTVTTNVAAVVGLAGWGMYIGSRRELFWTLKERVRRAEAEQELRVGQARTGERARIAREMHDVLAHHISQLSMYSGALAFREDLDADEMRANAAFIQKTARRALVDLRGVLGVLRDESGEVMDQPQPRFEDIADLVGEAREAGMRVDFTDTTSGTVPDVTGRTAYRIVQEGITNVSKHAPDALLTVALSGSPADGLTIKLRNPLGFGQVPASPASGLGLIGLQERTTLLGGAFRKVEDGKTFRLEGWLPWNA